VIPTAWQSWWTNRVVGVPSAHLRTFPLLELNALWRLRRGESPEAVFHERNAEFQRSIPDHWIEEATHVIGFDTSSWLLAERCHALARPFVLDQSIGHARAKERVYRDLRERFPDWSDTIPSKSEAQLQCEDKEHAVAHTIVTPSSFARQTLLEQGVPVEKIRVIPFGTDLEMFCPAKDAPPLPVVFLYAGALTARKGVPVLLEAWQRAAVSAHAELWLAGPGRLPASVAVAKSVRLLGSLSRSQLADAMRRAHVFVFPSFFEGLAQVQVEALATGLPVIGTHASGADDIVTPNETGFVLPAGAADELAECFRRFSQDHEMRDAMRIRCLESRSDRGWSSYGKQWFALLSQGRPSAH
jgi:glycosyltransferase involved in cell wall biosynthesis